MIRDAVAALVLLLSARGGLQAQGCREAPWDSVAMILQARGTDVGGACRYGWPRTDLTVRVGDVTVHPAIALGSWAGFGAADSGGGVVVLGDFVLTGAELGRVLRQFTEDGVAVTAIHNHLVGEEPRIVYVHFEGRGSAVALARKVAAALVLTGAPRPAAPPPAGLQPVTIDTALVFRELGARGRVNGAVVQLSFNLVGTEVTLRGHAVPQALVAGSPVNLQAVSPSRVVATGDFTLPGAKLDPVLDALTAHGITATAVHSHLVDESPPLYFVHFWADGRPLDVLRGLRAVLDAAREPAAAP